jgi:hypothetical protein
MPSLIRCKACGYVTYEGKIKDACPACGVSAKMFENYADPVAEKRRRILRMHIHPIIVHFPQSFAFTLFVLAVLSFVAPPQINEGLHCTIQVLASALPFSLILALLTGLVDGKTRFRRVTTLFLKKKIIFGLSFLFTSILISVVAFTLPLSSASVMALFTMLTIIAVGFSIALGMIGGELMDAKFPG